MKRKILYFVFGVTLAAGLLALWRLSKSESRQVATGPSETYWEPGTRPSRMPGRKHQASATRPWKAGNRYVYQSELSSSLFLGDTSDPMVSFSVDGTVAIDVVESSADKTLLHVQYRSPKFDIAGGDASNSKSADAEELAEMKQGFESPFFIAIDGRGALSEVLVPEKLMGHVQNTFKTLAGLIQYVAPVGDEATWEATEADRTGDYLAAYADDPASGTTTKTKLRYLDAGSESDEASESTPEVIDSHTTYTWHWHPGGAIERLAATDHVKVASSTLQFTGSSETELLMTLQTVGESTRDASALLAMADAYISSSPNGPSTRYARQQVIDRAKIAGLDLGTALGLLDRFKGESAEDRHTRQKAFLAMEAMFRQDPGAMRQALQKIRAGNPHAKTLISALGYAGTPKAQDALMDLLTSGDEEHPLAVMRALSSGDRPTEENIELHKKMMDDPKLGRQARFGLGANAHTLIEQGKKPQADEIFDLLVEELNNATSQDETVLVLKALGNTGHPRLLEVLPGYLSHADEVIRSVALNALRKTPTGQADNLVASMLIRDPSVAVRNVAIKVIGERPLTAAALNALDQVVHNDAATNIRHRAVTVLGGLNANPDAVAILRWVAEHEEVEQIRETAKNALAT